MRESPSTEDHQEIRTRTQPRSCHFPAEHTALLEHSDDASAADAELALGKFARALGTSECTYHADLVQALGSTP